MFFSHRQNQHIISKRNLQNSVLKVEWFLNKIYLIFTDCSEGHKVRSLLYKVSPIKINKKKNNNKKSAYDFPPTKKRKFRMI